MKRHKNLRQGQTRWQAVRYEAGQLANYDVPVVAVYACRVTAVRGTTVNYTSHGPYICGREWFVKNTLPTYRAAVRDAHRQLREGGAA